MPKDVHDEQMKELAHELELAEIDHVTEQAILQGRLDAHLRTLLVCRRERVELPLDVLEMLFEALTEYGELIGREKPLEIFADVASHLQLAQLGLEREARTAVAEASRRLNEAAANGPRPA